MKADEEGGGKIRWEKNEDRINEKLFRKIEENEKIREEEKIKRMRIRKEGEEAQPQEQEAGEDLRKRANDQHGDQEEWQLRRKRRGEDRQQPQGDVSKKRPAEEPSAEDVRESKAQALEPEGISSLWRTSEKDSWAWRIEGGISERWRLRKGVIMDLGTRDENGEPWNFDDEDKRCAIREFIKNKKPLLLVGSHLQAVVEKLAGTN